MAVLEIKDLTIEFGDGPRVKRAVDAVSFAIEAGEALCLVGESGSGKSVTARAIARLLPRPLARYVSGEIWLNGYDTLKLYPPELRRFRGGVVSYVFQEPGVALNPVMRVGAQIMEALSLHQPKMANWTEVQRLLRLVRIPDPASRQEALPHQLSGGMKQRVMIAMALASRPKLLVADEPTTALDVTTQAQILDLLNDLKQQLCMSVLLITHHLGIINRIADWLAVMYAGQIVETGPAKSVMAYPLHPYTQALIAAVPYLGHPTRGLRPIRGSPPEEGVFQDSCRFSPRCDYRRADCEQSEPKLIEAQTSRFVRCPYWSYVDRETKI